MAGTETRPGLVVGPLVLAAEDRAREAELVATRAGELERELAKARERNEQLTREVEELRLRVEEATALEEQRMERQKSRRFGPRR